MQCKEEGDWIVWRWKLTSNSKKEVWHPSMAPENHPGQSTVLPAIVSTGSGPAFLLWLPWPVRKDLHLPVQSKLPSSSWRAHTFPPLTQIPLSRSSSQNYKLYLLLKAKDKLLLFSAFAKKVTSPLSEFFRPVIIRMLVQVILCLHVRVCAGVHAQVHLCVYIFYTLDEIRAVTSMRFKNQNIVKDFHSFLNI